MNEMNWIDRAAAYLNPKWGMERLQYRKMQSAYSGGGGDAFDSAGATKRSLMNWWPRMFSGSNEMSETGRRTMVARAYDAYRNQEIARAAVNRVKTNVVATGLNLIPLLDEQYLGLSEQQTEELETAIEREFGFWSAECDIQRTLNFGQMQALAIVTCLIAGDCFANTVIHDRPGDLFSLKLQMIDGERVCNPNSQLDTNKIRKGVELDEYGAPIAYHVLRVNPHDHVINSKAFVWDRVSAYGSDSGRKRIIHLFDKELPEQVRGVSWLAPILDSLKQIKRMTEAELMAAVINGYLTVFIESEGGDENYGYNQKESSDPKRPFFELGPGAIIELEKGKKVTPVASARPNVSFEPFLFAVMRQVSAALEMPIDEILLRFEASYSAARAAMLKAWLFYRTRQEFLARNFCQPIYGLWFDEAVERGVLPHVYGYEDPRRRLAYQSAIWQGVGRGAIDEVDEATAAEKRIQIGVSSVPMEAALLKGANWKNIIKQQKKALREMRQAGLISSGMVAQEKQQTAIKPDQGKTNEDSKEAKDTKETEPGRNM